MFSCDFCEISKNIFLTEHLRTNASDSGFIVLCDLSSHDICGLRDQVQVFFWAEQWNDEKILNTMFHEKVLLVQIFVFTS